MKISYGLGRTLLRSRLRGGGGGGQGGGGGGGLGPVSR